MHEHWNNGAFALKPLPIAEGDVREQEGLAIKVQLFWQPLYDHHRVLFETQPATSEGLEGSGNRTATWYSFQQSGAISRCPLKSGSVLTITSPDPQRCPLPDRSLLELQWKLQRVAGMKGAADKDLEEHDSGSGSECEGMKVEKWLKILPGPLYRDLAISCPLDEQLLSPEGLFT